jgi:hypothetical protein
MGRIRHSGVRALLIAIALTVAFGLFVGTRFAGAQGYVGVTVTAGISSAMALTACDTTADFGNGLTALGGTPSGTQDQVTTSERGNGALGQGIIYIWTPACPAGESFLQIESTLPWELKPCARAILGSSSLSVQKGDLGWIPSSTLQNVPSFDFADLSTKFNRDCVFRTTATSGPLGLHTFDVQYTLRVDLDDQAGDFRTQTYWVLNA